MVEQTTRDRCGYQHGVPHDHVEQCHRGERAVLEAERQAAVRRVQDRIDNLLSVADRFDHPGGSRALARRAHDKAAGMETALRLLTTYVGAPGGEP